MQQWVRQGIFEAALDAFADILGEACPLDLRECFIDGTFAPAKRGGAGVGKTKKGKGSKLMAMVEADGLPNARVVNPLPERLIDDQAYDSDGLDANLAEQGTEWIAAHRKGRSRTQDGQLLRRKKRRWKVERYLVWLQAVWCLPIRWKVTAEN